jgi:hypothetical protein
MAIVRVENSEGDCPHWFKGMGVPFDWQTLSLWQ